MDVVCGLNEVRIIFNLVIIFIGIEEEILNVVIDIGFIIFVGIGNV